MNASYQASLVNRHIRRFTGILRRCMYPTAFLWSEAAFRVDLVELQCASSSQYYIFIFNICTVRERALLNAHEYVSRNAQFIPRLLGWRFSKIG